MKFTTTRTPKAAIRLVQSFDQQHFIALVETIEKRRDFIGQIHFPMAYNLCPDRMNKLPWLIAIAERS